MPKQQDIIFDGIIIKDCSNSFFKIELENGHEVLATISGKMRTKNIRVYEGDKVSVAITPYDLSRGLIKFRYNPDGTKPYTENERTQKKKKIKQKSQR